MGNDFYESLKQFSNAGVINFSNPLDMGDIYDPKLTAHVIYSVMHSEQVDGSIYISQRPQMPQGENVFQKMFLADISMEAWGSILSAGKPLGICLFGPTRTIQQAKRYVEFPIFNSPEEMIKALAAQMKYYERRKKLLEHKEPLPLSAIDQTTARRWMLDKQGEYGEETFELLEAYGIKTAASRTAVNPNEAIEHARTLGYPVVLKVVSPDALHKSDVGGVILNLKNDQEVANAFLTIKNNLLRFNKDALFSGVRIQKMAGEGFDLFIGGKHDPSFGPVVFFGMGGIYIEAFRDVANILCPARPESIAERLASLRSAAILKGLRGQPAGDTEAFIDLVMRTGQLLADFPGIKELDINPVRVFPSGKGVIALDTRVRISLTDD
jgi:acetate---CoA ligase (ADP-forming)